MPIEQASDFSQKPPLDYSSGACQGARNDDAVKATKFIGKTGVRMDLQQHTRQIHAREQCFDLGTEAL